MVDMLIAPEQLLQVVLEKYKSLESPDLRWVAGEHERRPYDEIEHCLGELFSVEEVTDLNNDVSCVLALSSREAGDRWTLRLSLLGPYAVLLRETGEKGQDVYVASTSDTRSQEERWILEVCRQHAVDVLGPDVLKTPVQLRLLDTDPENVRLYQALFSDNDVLPVERDAESRA